ncbi:MAG TPA: AAA family ATPase [Candidatus Glassbacteria bacterium]|nr:AAA family ATPase [Candidatus Glassbacteria bacterium]
MLKVITIKNFQSHRETTLRLSPGVNIIKGQSDSGKSSIIRAIKWVLTNRPTGSAFQTAGVKEETSVRLSMDSERIIRRRGTGINEYNVSGSVLKAIGTDVPQEVLDIVNMDHTNFQDQFGSLLLLQDSPGKVASILNELIGQEIIDESFKRADRIIREEKVKQNGLNSDIDLLTKKKIKLKKVPDLTKKFKVLYKQKKDIERLEEQIKKAEELQESLFEIEEEFLKVSRIKNIDYRPLEKLVKSMLELENKINGVQEIIHNFNVIENRISKNRTGLSEAEKELSKFKFCPYCNSKL